MKVNSPPGSRLPAPDSSTKQMSQPKSPKELAFLHDLYVAPDWGERFAELVDAHVKPPREGRALYVAAGTGRHALARKERAGEKLQLVCVEESGACVGVCRR